MSEEFEEMFDEGDKRNVFSTIFTLKKILGKGSFGTVVSAIQHSDQKEVAVKILQKTPQNKAQYIAFLNEAELLKQLKHANIVKFEKIIESETRAFLVMELIKGGQLQEYIDERRKQKSPITDEEAATIMRAIFTGLQEIHSKDVIHRDLKPQNILLADKNNLESIKICDFGLATQYDPTQQMSFFNTRVGTRIFMAPELWQRKQYSKPVDMWSCGIIMYMLLSGGKHPVYVHGDSETTYWAKMENMKWEFPSTFNKYSKDLFFKIINSDPISRYTIEQIQSHPWITRRFNDDIPLTSPEKMKAFSQSQTLSRIIKTMYIINQLPGANVPIDSEHKQKIEELNVVCDLNLDRRKSSFVDTFKVLFAGVQTEPNELTLTTSASNANRETCSSPSPLSFGLNSQYSPNFPSPNFGPNLLTIPETSHIHRETENTPMADTRETQVVKKMFFNDEFTLPETQNEVPEIKKLQFTISVLPVKLEESTASNSKGSTPYQKPKSIPSIEETSLRKSIRIKKLSKERERDDKDSLSVKPKNNNNSTVSGTSNSSSQVPSPSNKTSPNKLQKKYTFKNTLDAELLDQLKLSRRKEDKSAIRDQKSKVLDSPTNRSIDSPDELGPRSVLVPSNAGKDFTSKEGSKSQSPQKSRTPTPLVRRASRVIKAEDIKPKTDQNNVRLPSIGAEPRVRNASVLRSRPGEQKVRINESKLSSSSKPSKDWSMIKEGKSTLFTNTDKSMIKGQFGSILEPNFYQTFIKK